MWPCPVTRRGATVTLSLSAAARPGVKLCLYSAALLCTALHCTVLYCAGVMCEYGRVKGHRPPSVQLSHSDQQQITQLYLLSTISTIYYLIITALHLHNILSTTYLLNYSFTLGHSSGETETSCR